MIWRDSRTWWKWRKQIVPHNPIFTKMCVGTKMFVHARRGDEWDVHEDVCLCSYFSLSAFFLSGLLTKACFHLLLIYWKTVPACYCRKHAEVRLSLTRRGPASVPVLCEATLTLGKRGRSLWPHNGNTGIHAQRTSIHTHVCAHTCTHTLSRLFTCSSTWIHAVYMPPRVHTPMDTYTHV